MKVRARMQVQSECGQTLKTAGALRAEKDLVSIPIGVTTEWCLRVRSGRELGQCADIADLVASSSRVVMASWLIH